MSRYIASFIITWSDGSWACACEIFCFEAIDEAEARIKAANRAKQKGSRFSVGFLSEEKNG